MKLVVAKVWANLSGFLWLHFPDKASLCLRGTEAWECYCLAGRKSWVWRHLFCLFPGKNAGSCIFEKEQTSCSKHSLGQSHVLMLQIRTDLFWEPAFPERSGWHTNYSLFLAIACSGWMSFWKLLTRSAHHPEEPGLHTAWSTHTKYSLLKFTMCKYTLDKKNGCKNWQGRIVVSTTAVIRVKFVSQIIHREANSSKIIRYFICKE